MQTSSIETPTQAELLSQELFLSSLVHDLTRVLLSSAKINDAKQTFLLGVAEITGSQRILMLGVPSTRQQKLTVEHSLGLPSILVHGLKIVSKHPLISNCLVQGMHKWVEKLEANDPFISLGTSQYLLVPIIANRHSKKRGGEDLLKCIALLWIDTSPPASPLTAQALSHLNVLSKEAGLVLENFQIREELTLAYAGMKKTNRLLHQLNEDLQKAQKRLQTDLERARQLQRGLLPRVIPSHLLRDFASRYIPAGQVGGDYYDCFEASPGRIDIVIADVSGHGASAALVMTMFKVLLKTLAPQGHSPSQILAKINGTFLNELDGRHFVTVFYGIFDREERTLTYCSAGHIPQFLIGPDRDTELIKLTELPSHGLVLGMFPNIKLGETRVEIGERPARLILYTDGISEAHCHQGTMFGMDKFRDLVIGGVAESAEKLGSLVMQALAEFRLNPHNNKAVLDENESPPEEDELADDVTLVILDL